MKSILVTGANGQLGNELRLLTNQYPELKITFTDVDELNITDPGSVVDYLGVHDFDFCINCAAYTAVDKAETDMEMAFKINTEAAGIMAAATKEFGVKLIHISTDFVFDGKKSVPYLEDDIVTPLNIYGKSKWRGEQECLAFNNQSIVIRTSWLYSSFGNNFVKTMQRLGREKDELGVIYDQVGVPTYAADLANAILNIVNNFEDHAKYGIFHYSNEGVCSWYDFAVAIMELSQLNCKVNPIETKAYPTPARRGHYTVMNKQKIKDAFGLEIPHWRESLVRCIEKIKQDA